MKIGELQLKAQPSNLPEVREQCMTTVIDVIAAVASALMDCRPLLSSHSRYSLVYKKTLMCRGWRQKRRKYNSTMTRLKRQHTLSPSCRD